MGGELTSIKFGVLPRVLRQLCTWPLIYFSELVTIAMHLSGIRISDTFF